MIYYVQYKIYIGILYYGTYFQISNIHKCYNNKNYII